MDFTLNQYEKLCFSIYNSKYTAITLADYLRRDDNETSYFIIMQHDIDIFPKRALDIAMIEDKYQIRASYYFRLKRGIYIPDIIDKVASYRHEIGFHYETVDKCKGNIEEAKELFKKELAQFKKIYPVKTVCAHGNALTKNDNMGIWNNQKFESLDLYGDRFLSLDFNKFAYFSDSGRTWLNNKFQKMPGKDYIETAFIHTQAKTTDDLIQIISEGSLPNICILSHPDRWTKGIIPYMTRFFIDQVFRLGKVVIVLYRDYTNK